MKFDSSEALVIFVDDDASIREALLALAESIGINACAYGSVQEFLENPRTDRPCCLVLDVRMPGRSGLDLQAELAREAHQPPVIFLTGHGDIPMSVRAMKAGAIEFLTKPFRDQDLIDAIQQGLETDRRNRNRLAAFNAAQERYSALSSREREVMLQVTKGLLNKQIAGNLGLSEITVKVHRRHMMDKMGARSVADLVRLADGILRASDED